MSEEKIASWLVVLLLWLVLSMVLWVFWYFVISPTFSLPLLNLGQCVLTVLVGRVFYVVVTPDRKTECKSYVKPE